MEPFHCFFAFNSNLLCSRSLGAHYSFPLCLGLFRACTHMSTQILIHSNSFSHSTHTPHVTPTLTFSPSTYPHLHSHLLRMLPSAHRYYLPINAKWRSHSTFDFLTCFFPIKPYHALYDFWTIHNLQIFQ